MDIFVKVVERATAADGRMGGMVVVVDGIGGAWFVEGCLWGESG